MRRATRARGREQAASDPGSAAASRAGPAARPRLPWWPAGPPLLASRCRSERSRATSVFPTSRYRLVDERYQRLSFERLAQERQGPRLHRARAPPLLGKTGNEEVGDV